jgi:mRNA-degrading endonuclease RelE of RelBE toxin-antitoxin system
MTNKWKITQSEEFYSELYRLPANVIKKAVNALMRMCEDPWAQELHPEKIKSAEDGVHSSKADDGYRIVWKHIKPDHIVFCLVDKHDDAYRRASRMRFRLRDGVVSIIDIIDESAKPTQTIDALFQGHKQDRKYGKLFIGYTDNELLEMGLTEENLPHVRVLDDLNEIESIERLLPIDVYNHLLSLALGIVDKPVVSDEKLRTSLEKYQGGDELYSFVNTEEFHRALDGSLEDWMLFLASSQRVLANRDYNGSARVRGVAGSGKTVVALHRARYLARKPETKKVLFLTYGNRLPNVIKYLFEKLVGNNSPEVDKFECLSIHQLCRKIMSQNGLNPQVDDKLCKKALDQAILKVRQKSTLTSLFNRPSQIQ